MPGERVVGSAAIKVTADASGFAQSLQRQGDAAGKNVAARIGGAIGSGLRKSAAITGVAVGGVLGTALVKGFQRLSSIDQATQKLAGLGHNAAEVKVIMDNALASVKGTAFGLGDAASQAASLVAAGIKPGKDLERTLKLLADTSTIAGVDLNDMGLVFGKVAASGKLTGESLMQLQERGVPVMKFLADTTGKSMEQVQKDISAGKISFETFQKAMEQGLGGAAASSGKTFVGAWANVQAALGRVGAGLLGGVFKQMTGVFATFVSWLDKMTPAATRFGDAFGVAFGKAWTVAKALIDLIFKGDYTGGLGDILGIEEDSAIIGVILGIRDAVVSLLDKVGPALDRLPTGAKIAGIAGGLALIAPALSGMVGSLPLVGGLVQNITGLGTAGRVVGPVFQRFGPMITKGLTSPIGLATLGIGGLLVGLLAISKDGGAGFNKFVADMAAKIVEFVGKIPAIVQTIAAMLPSLITSFIGVITTALGTLTTILPVVIKAVIDVVSAVVKLLPTLLPILLNAAVALFMGLVDAAVTILPMLIRAIIAVVNAIVKLLPTYWNTLLDAAITLVMALVDALPVILPQLLRAFVDLVDALISSFDTILPVLLDAAVMLFLALVDALPKIIPPLLDAVVTLINTLINYLPVLIPVLLDAAVRLFMALVAALPKIIGALIQAVIAVIGAVLRLLPTLIPALISAGFTLFVSLVRAVPMILGALLSAFGTVLSRAWKFITDTFEGWRKGAIEWFGKIGKGIADKWGELTSWLRKPVDTALQWIQVNLIDRFNGLLEKLGISWRIGRIWTSGRGSAAGLKTGGWTGGGSPNKPAGVVHGREWVLNAKSTAALMRDYGVGFLRALNGYAAGGWVSPVVGYKPAFPWGRYPSGGIHRALDYAVPTGTPVLAPDDGRVVKAGWDPTGYGISVFLDHANGLFSVLGHLRSVLVNVGRFVAAGVRVGYSDNTGRSTGPHLHWGVMQGGIYGPGVNPGVVSAAGGIDIKQMLADLVRSISRGAGGGLDWLGEHLGPMGRIISGIGKKMLGFLTEKALDMLGFGEGGGRVGGPVPFRQYDAGGLLPPGLSMAYNGTGRPEPVGWGYGDITVQMNVSVDDLAKMSQIGDFLKMLDNARIEARRTERSGRVSA